MAAAVAALPVEIVNQLQESGAWPPRKLPLDHQFLDALVRLGGRAPVDGCTHGRIEGDMFYSKLLAPRLVAYCLSEAFQARQTK